MNPSQMYPGFGLNTPYMNTAYGQMQAQHNQQTQGNVLPPQTVIQVDGKASVDAIRMSPNSSVLLMDKTAPIVWLCTSDGLGNVARTAYDISIHEDAPVVDTATIESRLSAVEAAITEMREIQNAKSDDATVESKQYLRPIESNAKYVD